MIYPIKSFTAISLNYVSTTPGKKTPEPNNFFCTLKIIITFGIDEAVGKVASDICNGLDTGSNGVADLFLDFSKACDLADLLQKLKYYGVNWKGLNMFESYFKNRKQYVEINQSDKCSM